MNYDILENLSDEDYVKCYDDVILATGQCWCFSRRGNSSCACRPSTDFGTSDCRESPNTSDSNCRYYCYTRCGSGCYMKYEANCESTGGCYGTSFTCVRG